MNPFLFNSLLEWANVPIKQTLLLRHQKIIPGRPTPYSLWRDRREEFERFQTYQSPASRATFARPFWVSFVVLPDKGTLFVGLYRAERAGSVPPGVVDPVTGLQPGADKENSAVIIPSDLYECKLDDRLSEYIGRIKVVWGRGHRSWTQTASNQNKEIVELAPYFKEDAFPGYTEFLMPLSGLFDAPISWQTALSSVRGIYLLTCPKTKEQYVGKATGEHGFWGRWSEYFRSGHGGNVGLKSRDPSDYQISILEVCGSGMSEAEITELESLWKRKLQSREMGLNRN